MQGESKSEKHSPKKKPCAGQSNFSKSTGFLVDNQKKNGGKGKSLLLILTRVGWSFVFI